MSPFEPAIGPSQSYRLKAPKPQPTRGWYDRLIGWLKGRI